MARMHVAGCCEPADDGDRPKPCMEAIWASGSVCPRAMKPAAPDAWPSSQVVMAAVCSGSYGLTLENELSVPVLWPDGDIDIPSEDNDAGHNIEVLIT
jgi:hypothetical protein